MSSLDMKVNHVQMLATLGTPGTPTISPDENELGQRTALGDAFLNAAPYR